MKSSMVVSEIILNQEGKFITEDILNQIGSKLDGNFKTKEDESKYIKNKLDRMCELGLIGKTELYYFSI